MVNESDDLTSSYGTPVGDPTNTLTAGSKGPSLIQDTTFFDTIQSFNRERVPDRVVHGKGAGAFGKFRVTNDITKYTSADIFSKVGSVTQVTARFSQVGGESGSADTVRDVRGFSVKFHTAEGIWDLVGNNLPVFFIRDAILFPDLIHSQRRNPQTHLHDNNMFWDFNTLRPETTLLIMYYHSALGIPASYRQMNGYGIHTFRLVNSTGNVIFAKFHWRSHLAVSNLTVDEADQLAGVQPDYYIEDLYDAISTKNFPHWTLSIQVMTMEQAEHFRWNIFDATKEWPEDEYPLMPVGTMELDRNQENYFVDVELIGFNPGRLVPGIEPSPDKLLQGRLFAYADTQTYRLGSNNQLLRINKPYNRIANYERDGFARPDQNQDSAPNYYPDSFKGPQPSSRGNITSYPVQGEIGRFDTSDEDNYSQPQLLWRRLSSREKHEMVSNMASTLRRTYPFIQQRAIHNFYQVSPEMASMLSKQLGTTGDF